MWKLWKIQFICLLTDKNYELGIFGGTPAPENIKIQLGVGAAHPLIPNSDFLIPNLFDKL